MESGCVSPSALNIVERKDLNKTYKDGVQKALDSVSFSGSEYRVFGVIG